MKKLLVLLLVTMTVGTGFADYARNTSASYIAQILGYAPYNPIFFHDNITRVVFGDASQIACAQANGAGSACLASCTWPTNCLTATPPAQLQNLIDPNAYPDLYKFRGAINVTGQDLLLKVPFSAYADKAEEAHQSPNGMFWWKGNNNDWETKLLVVDYPNSWNALEPADFTAAYQDMGFIIHLVQDSFVPAHTKDVWHGLGNSWLPGPYTDHPVTPVGFLGNFGSSDNFERFVTQMHWTDALVATQSQYWAAVNAAVLSPDPASVCGTTQYWLDNSQVGPGGLGTWGAYGGFPTEYGVLINCNTPNSSNGSDIFPNDSYYAGAASNTDPQFQAAFTLARMHIYVAAQATAAELMTLSNELPPLILLDSNAYSNDFTINSTETIGMSVQENRSSSVNLSVRELTTGRYLRATIKGVLQNLDGTSSTPLTLQSATDLTKLPYADDLQLSWDGTMSDGGALPVGTYTFQVTAVDGDNNVGFAASNLQLTVIGQNPKTPLTACYSGTITRVTNLLAPMGIAAPFSVGDPWSYSVTFDPTQYSSATSTFRNYFPLINATFRGGAGIWTLQGPTSGNFQIGTGNTADTISPSATVTRSPSSNPTSFMPIIIQLNYPASQFNTVVLPLPGGFPPASAATSASISSLGAPPWGFFSGTVTGNSCSQVAPTSQTISFAAISQQTVGTSLLLAASASSGLPVTYAASPSTVCSVSGSAAAFSGPGTCTITASQAGDSLYSAATPITQTFTVVAALMPQTITFGAISQQIVGTPLVLTATASSGLPVSLSASPSTVCMVNGSTASFSAPGSCSITASQAGNSTYSPATLVTQTFTVLATPGASAAYLAPDTLTQGNWTGSYGIDGFLIVGGANATPAYATVSLTGDSAWTWANPTSDPRALQTASGATTHIASTFYSTGSSFNININLTDGNPHRIALYLLDWDSNSRAETISILDAATNAVLSTQSFSNFEKGQFAAWNINGHVIIQVAGTSGANAVVAGVFFDPVVTSLASAKYVGMDASTQGTWAGSYGLDGNLIATETAAPPSYATVTVNGAATYTWGASTADPRALQTASGATTRIASTYYSAGSFTINVNVTDSNTHKIALYLLDWDSGVRAETITISDANSHALLDTESYANFHNGVYATWNISGSVIIQVTDTGGANPVVAGLFFDPASTIAPAGASYLGTDTTTQGAWTGKYGSTGYLIANDANNTPNYATVGLAGDNTYTWAASTADLRALQVSSGASSGIASTYYAANSFTINVNLFDGNTHKVSIYLLDWDSTVRAETISLIDANSHVLLNTQHYSSFQNGEYAIWNVKGNVIIQVLGTSGANAVVSGIFFD